MAALYGFRSRRGRGRPSCRFNKTGHDERFLADLTGGTVPAMVATRDQGDSLAAAQALADMSGWTITRARPGQPRPADGLSRRQPASVESARARAAAAGPPTRDWRHDRRGTGGAVGGRHDAAESPNAEMYSCLPEHVIENYTQCMRWTGPGASPSTPTSSGARSTGCCAIRAATHAISRRSPGSWGAPDVSGFAPGSRRPARPRS